MNRIDKVMSELLKYIVPHDEEKLKAIIMSHSCQRPRCDEKCSINKKFRCWKGEYKG